MIANHAVLQLLGGMCLLAAAVATRATSVARDAKLRQELEAVSRETIFFGHQSVGENVLDGVRRLAAAQGVPLRLEQAGATAAAPHQGAWLHARIGENGNPDLKLQSFVRAIDEGAPADVALMKFCYVDFHAATDPAALFARYRTAVRGLQERHPRTTFVHVTVPLTAPQGVAKSLAKRLLGRETSEAENARREQFNAALRDAFLGREPLFNLARLEATHEDGRAETITWRGRAVPVLVAAYTDDGGHLNAKGQDRVARELVALLAALPRAPAPAATGGARP